MRISHRDQVRLASEWARWYRDAGLNPLPSSQPRRMPELNRYREDGSDYSYLRERDEGVPEGVLRSWGSRNIQLATGRRWGLLVVDVDGPVAMHRWEALKASLGGHDPTWEVRSGRWEPGRPRIHLYFAVSNLVHPIPKRPIWFIPSRENPRQHQEGTMLECIGDGGLVIAPPSLHAKTGRRYEFAPGRGPDAIPRPSPAPEWLVRLVEDRPVPRPEPAPRPRPAPSREARSRHHDWDEVRAALSEEGNLMVAEALGLKIRRRGTSGWWSCDRPLSGEENPSGAFHPEIGIFKDMKHNTKAINLAMLAVELGKAADFCEGVDLIGDMVLGGRS